MFLTANCFRIFITTLQDSQRFGGLRALISECCNKDTFIREFAFEAKGSKISHEKVGTTSGAVMTGFGKKVGIA